MTLLQLQVLTKGLYLHCLLKNPHKLVWQLHYAAISRFKISIVMRLLSVFSVGGMWVFSSKNCFNHKILILSNRNILQNTFLSITPWSQSRGCQGNPAWRPHLIVEVHFQPGWLIGVTKGFGKLLRALFFQCCWKITCNSFLGLLVSQVDMEPLVRKTLHCPQLPDHSFMWASFSFLLCSWSQLL